jgi:hypothetical protein
MIVNPQLFNYRLIISSLVVVLLALGAYSYSSYETVKAHETFLLQEKELIQSELSEILSNYETLSEDYQSVSEELDRAKKEIQLALDSLEILNGNVDVVIRYKAQLKAIKLKNSLLLETIDSLKTQNERLLEEKRLAFNTLKEKDHLITALKSEQNTLSKTLEKASLITVSKVESRAFKLLRNNTKKATDKARRTDALDICITFAENPVADSGNKTIYIQVLSPANNVLSDQGAVSFGDDTLIYSKKDLVDYQNTVMEFCTTITCDNNDKPLEKGRYTVNVFNDDRMLNSTSFELK